LILFNLIFIQVNVVVSNLLLIVSSHVCLLFQSVLVLLDFHQSFEFFLLPLVLPFVLDLDFQFSAVPEFVVQPDESQKDLKQAANSHKVPQDQDDQTVQTIDVVDQVDHKQENQENCVVEKQGNGVDSETLAVGMDSDQTDHEDDVEQHGHGRAVNCTEFDSVAEEDQTPHQAQINEEQAFVSEFLGSFQESVVRRKTEPNVPEVVESHQEVDGKADESNDGSGFDEERALTVAVDEDEGGAGNEQLSRES
jgi:hypothetical protein